MFFEYSKPRILRFGAGGGVLSLDSTLWGQPWMHPHGPKALNHFTGTTTG
jgi:hypothetical protein